MHKWTCLHGSEWTHFVDAFLMQQRAENMAAKLKMSSVLL